MLFSLFHMNGLPHFSMTGSYINTHTLCMHKNTHERNPPREIFFSIHLRKGKGEECCQCCLRSSLAGFPPSHLQLQRLLIVLHKSSSNKNHWRFTESVLAKHGPSKASWHELMKMKGKLSLPLLQIIHLAPFLHVEVLVSNSALNIVNKSKIIFQNYYAFMAMLSEPKTDTATL